jgi:hypothetical protein
VRDDLSSSQKMVQACHACIEAARLGLVDPEAEHPHLALLAVSSQRELLKAADRLDRAGVPYKQFLEPDLDNSITALCTAPVSGETRRLFRRYQLLQSA